MTIITVSFVSDENVLILHMIYMYKLVYHLFIYFIG